MSKSIYFDQILGTVTKDRLALVDPVEYFDPVTKQYLEDQNYVPSTITINGHALDENITLDASDLSLENVANIAPADYPISTLQQNAFNIKASIGTISNFTSSFDTNSDVYIVTDKGKEGQFVYDAADSSSAQDGVLVLVKNNKRYKRVHNKIFYPSWWGIDETGTTTCGSTLNTVFSAALSNGAYVIANGTYLIDETTSNYSVNIRTNLSGKGTFKTRNSAQLTVLATGITISEITIDGGVGTATTAGRGLYNDGWPYVTVRNIKVFNTSGQGMWFRNTDYCKIIHNTTRNNVGTSGDGIYVAQAISPFIEGNHITEFQRIGISVEGSDTSFDYSKKAIVLGNTVMNAIPSEFESANYPNGGIWLENIGSCIVSTNTVENTYFRGIAVTPSISSTDTRYSYIIENNIVKNCHRIDSASGSGYGINTSYADYGTIIINANILTDCQRFIGAGGADRIKISNNIFNVDDDLPENVGYIITIDPIRTTDTTKRTNVVIENCVNDIVGIPSGKFLLIPNVNNQRLSLDINSCKGDTSFLMGTQQVNTDISIRNCLVDYTTISGSNILAFNITGKVLFQGCTIKMGGSIFPYCEELEFNNTRCYTDGSSSWILYTAGARILKIINSDFLNVYFREIRRANHEITLKNSNFDGYPTSQGLFSNTIALVDKLEVDGCRFSDTNISTSPISFAAGVTTVIKGDNYYATSNLFNISTITNLKQYRKTATGTTAQRPTSPGVGEEYNDTTLGRKIVWNGSTWIFPTIHAANTSATSAPTKSALNTTYGAYNAGSSVTYTAITGGGKRYVKITDSTTSDWSVQDLTLLA